MIQVFNKYLERFLYAHDIHFVNFQRTYDGAIVWEYKDDAYTRRVIEEWQEVQARRQAHTAHKLKEEEK